MAQETFVLELPLKVEKWQADILDKRYEYLRQIYNYVQKKLIRQYKYFEQMNEFRQCTTYRDKREFFRNHPFYYNEVVGRNGEPFAIKFPYSMSESNGAKLDGFNGYISKLGKLPVGANKTYADLGINSFMLERLASNMWSAWNKFLYDRDAKRVAFKKYGELNTFGSRKKNNISFIGMAIHLDTMELVIKTNGRNGQFAEYITLPIGTGKPLTEYEMYALKSGFDSIKILNVVRKQIRGNNKYYLQMTIEGEKPQKGRTLGEGCVGIDLGPSTIAVSSLQKVSIDKLANKCDDIQRDLNRVSRKMDRSRRANNPQNFNEDGTIKPISRKSGERRVWHDSKRYKKLREERKELLRKQAAIRKAQHIETANALLPLGDTFIVENNPVSSWTRKSKETKINKKGKIQSKKRFGKSVANHAPSMFATILQNKVESLGGQFRKVEVKNAASRFDFTNGEFTEHGLGERVIALSNGDKHQRDLLAAFNLQHLNADGNSTKDYDVATMQKDYPTFCRLEREEMDLYLQGKKKNERTTIGAFK